MKSTYFVARDLDPAEVFYNKEEMLNEFPQFKGKEPSFRYLAGIRNEHVFETYIEEPYTGIDELQKRIEMAAALCGMRSYDIKLN